jgi:hypothetical protein
MLDMRALNALACNATVAVAERLNALEVHAARFQTIPRFRR